MHYRYTFNVKSYTHLARTLSFTHGRLKFRLVETDGRFTELTVQTESVTISLTGLRNPTQRAEPTFVVPLDPFVEVVIEEVRMIRGALALWGVMDIDVDQFLREFIPDTIEEEAAIQVKSIKYQRPNPDRLPLVPTTDDLLVRCVLVRQKLAPYEVPLEFYRRGADDDFRQQYVEAIFNFFFVLEYLFGEGQFRTTDLVNNFRASPKLLAGLADARSHCIPILRSEDEVKQFREKYGDRNDEQVIQTIVELRGKLHHQTIKRMNWHPALQKEFQMDANFTRAVCQSVLMTAVLEVLFEQNEERQFRATPVFDANGKPTQIVDPERSNA